MKNLRRTLLVIGCILIISKSLHAQTANQYVKPYTNKFEYGANMGYYSNGWNDEGLAKLVNKAGGRTIRTTLADHFVELYGINIRLTAFQHYVNNLEMKEITCFVEGPSAPHRDQTIYPGCPEKSRLFAKLYEPIWNADSTVNQNNYYAAYIDKVVKTYGKYIKIWEVVNEPDFAGGIPSNWLNRPPLPSELPNLWAPVFHYIRMLRITWEVVKKHYPDSYVCPGGIGYTEFLDCLLRYTDNPDSGAVSTLYPLKGGAYFDIVSYHYYPAYTMRYWDNSLPGFVHTRTSDYAASNVVEFKGALETTLNKYGYNGIIYPKKHFIITESNISRRTIDIRHSNDEMQRNFGIKSLVLTQKNDIKQFYFYMVGEAMNAPAPTDVLTGIQDYALMGLYENLKRDAPGQEKLTDLGKSMKTTTLLLYGSTYDATRTNAMNLPSGVEGGAFRKGNTYIYVLWAKALVDKSEVASKSYTFPAGFGYSNVQRYEWNYSTTGNFSLQPAYQIPLTASPSFFIKFEDLVLPADQFIFSATQVNQNQIDLAWTDIQAELVDYHIEKSQDGIHYSTLYSINNPGTVASSNYNYTDNNINQKNYYRIRRTKPNGIVYYSKTILIETNPLARDIKIYPNPAKGFVFLTGTTNETTIKIINASGLLCRELKGESNKMDVRFLQSGMYYLHISNKNHTSIQKIIIVN